MHRRRAVVPSRTAVSTAAGHRVAIDGQRHCSQSSRRTEIVPSRPPDQQHAAGVASPRLAASNSPQSAPLLPCRRGSGARGPRETRPAPRHGRRRIGGLGVVVERDAAQRRRRAPGGAATPGRCAERRRCPRRADPPVGRPGLRPARWRRCARRAPAAPPPASRSVSDPCAETQGQPAVGDAGPAGSRVRGVSRTAAECPCGVGQRSPSLDAGSSALRIAYPLSSAGTSSSRALARA